MERAMIPDQLVKMALECSIYVQPKNAGLTMAEIQEAGRRLGRRPGEIMDAIGQIPFHFGGSKYEPTEECVPGDFNFFCEPDYRNPAAFDFVDLHLRDNQAEVGKHNSGVPRSVLVNHGVVKGLKENDVEIAVTMGLIVGHLVERGGLICLAPNQAFYILATEQIAQNRNQPLSQKVQGRKELYEAVKDIIERRTDGRPASAEPIHAFEQELAGLGHDRFRIWWSRTASELRLANPAQMPMTVCILAAALSEGALTFVVKHARSLALGTMNSKTFGESPTRWSFDELLKSAAAGRADAIFDQKVHDRADRLNTIRQRIHAGRLMAEIPVGPIPDTRPEEAREALETLDIILRRIIDWIYAHRAS
jgi:hypothetical protein